MRITRHFTVAGKSAYEGIKFRSTGSEIKNPDGSVVFSQKDIEMPAEWSQVACDVLAQKYFRKAGVPTADNLISVPEEGVPEFLWRKAVIDPKNKAKMTGETTARQVFDRLAGTWTYWGWKGGYFDSDADASAFHDEMRHMLARQMGAPNSPQWFNTGLHWAYGVEGPAQGHFYVDHKTGKLERSTNAYERPQPHACFIQGISDDLVNEGGIMDLWVREARLFKYGSGTGTNFSALRGENERLSGGGKSSGLMSFLKIGDRAAGAIKSGGTTRRAAKMVVVNVDHPDIENFIGWKVVEEQKVAAMVTGSKLANKHLNAIMAACRNWDGAADDTQRFDPKVNKGLKKAMLAARDAQIPENYIQRVAQYARQGYTEIKFPILDTDWDSEAYLTVSGQNSNNSVRVTNEFLQKVLDDADWQLIRRTDQKVHKTVKASALWDQIGEARLVQRRSGHPVSQHHQRMAHLPGIGADQRLEPVLGIHVPGRHGVQPGLAQPAGLPPGRRQLRRRGLQARRPPVDRGAGSLGADGSVPLGQDRRTVLSLPHPRPGLRQYRRPADGRRPAL